MHSYAGNLAVPTARVLVAEDQPAVLDALRILLKSEGYEAEFATAPAAVLEKLRTGRFDLILMDLNYTRDTTSGGEGLDLLARIREMDDRLPVIVMTAWGSVKLAVEAMQRGAWDFVQKPWDNAHLAELLRSHLDKHHQNERRRRLDALEMEDATSVQQALLSQILPQFPGLEIAAESRPARVLGGDYYDVLTLSQKYLGLCIADVSGKGTGAALLMANLQAALRSIADSTLSPAAVCSRLNWALARNTATEKFVTLFYAVLDVERRTLTYSNAGHCAPVLVRSDGSILRLFEGGAVLGRLPQWKFEEQSVSLHAGDRLVLFTDGITESRNSEGDELGEAEVLQFLRQTPGLTATELKQRLINRALQHSGGAPQDDATVLVLAVNETKPRTAA